MPIPNQCYLNSSAPRGKLIQIRVELLPVSKERQCVETRRREPKLKLEVSGTKIKALY